MGIFDFFRRKPEPEPDDAGPSPHYVFAHYALRQVALANPLEFLGILASPKAEDFLDDLLGEVVNNCGRKATFNAADVKIHCRRVGDFPCVILELPEPGELAEAYLVALVANVSLAETMPPENVVARYFTLEKGMTLNGGRRNVFCEWDTTSHSNYGEGPDADPDAFGEAIESALKNAGGDR